LPPATRFCAAPLQFAEPLYIGRDEMPSGHFVRALRDVDVIGRVLTAEEVKALAAKGVK
jgi:hypothetical protein